MIDHVSVPTPNLAANTAFYTEEFTLPGLVSLTEREKTIGFGIKNPEYWLDARPIMPAISEGTGHDFARVRSKGKLLRRFIKQQWTMAATVTMPPETGKPL
ncbi:hypothetical protein ABVF61_07165 [Roseibium sp. HPY-6]|uniref:VOC family protein n=1 Tax=Roseibium sp. HPY-6 TaxID=3229852 RepID=UPI00338FE8C5